MGNRIIFLISFLVIHCTVNSMIFFNDGGEMFKRVGAFYEPQLYCVTLKLVYLPGLIAHIIRGLILWKQK